MFDSAAPAPRLVFLHIPKTAGQTIHNELTRAIGADHVSPVRVHTQATSPAGQFPTGYRLYSGHIDWTDLDRVPSPRFVFSILRDPRERIASFYFYLRREARKLDTAALELPQNVGKKAALTLSADDYFLGGDIVWRSFIKDHYDNFYCRFFASRKIRAGEGFSNLPDRRKLRAALRNMTDIDWVYSVENLGALESDLKTLFDFDISFSDKRDNASDRAAGDAHWPHLMALFETDAARAQMEDLVTLDLALMDRLEL